jgi:hypothetical protein
MSKGKEFEDINRGSATSGGPSDVTKPSADAIGVAGPSHDRSETYAACMQAYRWLSRRYRKTLDALAK